MEKEEFKDLIKAIKETFKLNDRLIDKALNEERSKNNAFDMNRVLEIIDKYKDIEGFGKENKKIAICYTGNPIVTISYIMDAFVNSNKVTLVVNDNKIINDLLISLILESMIECKLKNEWIDYDKSYNEVFLRDHVKVYDKIVYIGDYYEYEQFRSFIKSDKVEYNNYGYIKLFIDKKAYSKEYQKILNYCKKENIYLEVYDDIDDFVNEAKEEDFSIAFAEIRILNNIRLRFHGGQLMFNTFPFDSYEFRLTK